MAMPNELCVNIGGSSDPSPGVYAVLAIDDRDVLVDERVIASTENGAYMRLGALGYSEERVLKVTRIASLTAAQVEMIEE
jgi:hypothetical protein